MLPNPEEYGWHCEDDILKPTLATQEQVKFTDLYIFVDIMFSQIVATNPFYVRHLDSLWTRYKNDHLMYTCITFVRCQQHAYN